MKKEELARDHSHVHGFFKHEEKKYVVIVNPLNVYLKNEEVGFESRFAWPTDGWSISGQ